MTRHRTVVDVLRAAAEKVPDRDAFVEMDRRLSYSGLQAASGSLARMFSDAGVGRGDVVALLLPSSIEYAACYHGAMRMGAVTSGVNPRLGRSEKASIFERLGAKLTIVDDRLSAEQVSSLVMGRVIELPEVSAAVFDAAAAGRGTDAQPPAEDLEPDDYVAIVWTGGSTGVPKGALFDHSRLAAVAAGTDVLSNAGDIRLSPLPFAHVAFMTRAWDEIEKLTTTVITPTPWSAADALHLMEREKVTVGQGVPTQWSLILSDAAFAKSDLTALRVAGTGGSRVPPELARSMRERLGCPVVVRYTSTETSLGTSTAQDDPDEIVATTVGRPVPGVRLKVAGPDGEALRAGEVGSVHLGSRAAMIGYVERGTRVSWSPPGEDEAPWIDTGDLGWIGEDGNLRLVGRAVEMVIRGGYNIYPAEVEAVLGRHRSVAQVSVVGAPDPVLGEVVVAFVVARPGSRPVLDELRTFCKAELADYKAPDRVRVVDALPLTPIGKVDLRELKKMAAGPERDPEGARA